MAKVVLWGHCKAKVDLIVGEMTIEAETDPTTYHISAESSARYQKYLGVVAITGIGALLNDTKSTDGG